MKKNSLIKNLLLLSTVLSVGVAYAGKDVNPNGGNGSNPRPPAPSSIQVPTPACLTASSNAELNINNVRTTVHNGGDMFWDLNTQPRYEIPKVTDLSQPRRHSIFAGGIWIGGSEPGTSNIYVLAQTFRQGNQQTYWPGPIDSAVVNGAATSRERCSQWNHHFKCNRSTVNQFITLVEEAKQANRLLDISEIPEEILTWPGKKNPHLPLLSKYQGIPMDFSLARFFDSNGDGIYDPLVGDYPMLPGAEEGSGADQVIYWNMNDAGGVKQFGGGTTSPIIGLEIHTEAFAYATSDPTNNMTFYRQKLINKGGTILEQTYLGQWVDPDLGNPNDDYVECDVERGLGICFNGDDNDEGVQGYGSNPPTVAVDFFRGAFSDPYDGIDNDKDCVVDEVTVVAPPDTIRDSTGVIIAIKPNIKTELIMMSNFVYYNNDGNPKNGNPSSPQDYYNYLRSIWRDNTPMTYDGKNGTLTPTAAAPITKFIFPGGSDQNVGWSVGGTCANPRSPSMPTWTEVSSGNPPGDRRFLSSGGPYTLVPGAINELTIGIVWARATSGGPRGSFNTLLQADDIAQKLFDNDFKILSGPNSPDLEISELDGELIMSITPDEFVLKPPTRITSETYTELDPSLKSVDGDTVYRFQGYIIYQLADDRVSTGELNNPDKARVLLQCDVKDGITSIINQEYNPEVDALVPVLKIKGEDRGIQSSIRITRDLFAQGKDKLINHKKYYYLAVSYAYNGNSRNAVKYLQGRGNVQVYAAVPHKPESEQNGTIINSAYGTQLPIKRILGIGNGGNSIDILSSDIDSIVSAGYKKELTYELGSGPFSVKVYDPKRVKSESFMLKVTSSLCYKPNSVNDTLKPGDIIRSTLTFSNSNTSASMLQRQGRARVLRVVKQEGGCILLDIELLNGNEGGTFVRIRDIASSRQFSGYEYTYGGFVRDTTSVGGVVKTGTVSSFVPYDFWTITTANTTIYSKRTLSQGGEQLIPEYGISVALTGVRNPGELVYNNFANGIQDSKFFFDEPGQGWLSGIQNGAEPGQVQWLVEDTKAEHVYDDPNMVYLNVLNGSWAPYAYAAAYSNSVGVGGASHSIPADREINANLYSLANVNIVLTNDRSKWTRVPVIQMDSAAIKAQATKSRLTSVDKDFNPEVNKLSPYTNRGANTYPSRGMSWFPGYAVDIDKGIRLNMMFAESAMSDPVNGNNLKWEPAASTSRIGNKSFIYVGNSAYDEGREMERILDSAHYRFVTVPSVTIGTSKTQVGRLIASLVNWVGAVRWSPRTPGASPFTYPQTTFPTNANVKLRVNKAFASYPAGDATPTYNFNTAGLQVQRRDAATEKSALGLIRVVPNPYYAYSPYESSQVDNRVKIINLPSKCTIRIFNLGGSLIRQYNVDYSSLNTLNSVTSQDWDLKNQVGIPIASGVYLINVDAGSVGNVTLKWFGGTRPIDLDALTD